MDGERPEAGGHGSVPRLAYWLEAEAGKADEQSEWGRVSATAV